MLDGYERLSNGIIKQTKIFNKIITYDKKYIQQYEGFGEMGMRMSYLRLGNIIGTIGTKPTTLLDVGYGNGDFLKSCVMSEIECWGSDISGYPTPDNVKFIKWDDVFNQEFNVITFFDALEHFEDISFINKLNTNFVVISLPECHYDIFGDEWFKTWKHRKPDEHLWHFNRKSLNVFMLENGYEFMSFNNSEDVIRKPVDMLPNILTAIYKKIK